MLYIDTREDKENRVTVHAHVRHVAVFVFRTLAAVSAAAATAHGGCCICRCSEIIKPYYTTDFARSFSYVHVSLSREHRAHRRGLTSSMRFNATRWAVFGGETEISPVRAFFAHARKPRETRDDATRRGDDCGMCEINDVAQLSVINRGIMTVTIINIASLVRDNRSCQAIAKLRLE